MLNNSSAVMSAERKIDIAVRKLSNL